MVEDYNPTLFGIDPELESRIPIHDLVHLPGYRGGYRVIAGRLKPIYEQTSRGTSLALNDFKDMVFLGQDDDGTIRLRKSGLEYEVVVLPDGTFSFKCPFPFIKNLFKSTKIPEMVEAADKMANSYSRYMVADTDKVTSLNAYFTARVEEGKILLTNNTFMNRVFFMDAEEEDKPSNATFTWRFVNNTVIGVLAGGAGVETQVVQSQGKDYDKPLISGVEFDVPLELSSHCYAELTVRSGHVSSKYTLDLIPLLVQNKKGGKNG